MTQQIANQNTVAEKLAKKIQSSDLGDLIDEDDLAKITRDAIERAFFKDRDTGNYNGRKPPLIVEMAEDAFKGAIRKAAEPIAAEVVKSEEFQEALVKACLAQIPLVAQGMAYNLTYEGLQKSAQMSYDPLGQALRDKLQKMRDGGEL